MPRTAAVLVVLEQHIADETVEDTIAAMRQLRGVQGVTVFYDDVGAEIRRVRQIREDVERDVRRGS